MVVGAARRGVPGRRLVLALVVIALLLIVGGNVISLFTDLLWFREVHYTTVFATVLRTRVLLFCGFGLLMAALIAVNITVAYRVRPAFRPRSREQQNLERYRVAVEPRLRTLRMVTSGVFGLFAGLSAAGRWQTWLLWRHNTSFGVVDPQFHRDVSYFAMIYPLQRFVLGFCISAVVLSLLVAAATHYLFGSLRLQTVGEKVSPAAGAHLSVLVGVVVVLKAAGYYLDRFGLAFSTRGAVQGASFTDVNAVLPAKNILIFVALICSVLFFANIVVRNILLPAGALALLVLSAVVLGGLFPAYTQQFRVKPNEVAREQPYISRNIAATRAAYGINNVVMQDYNAQTTGTPAQLRADQATVPNARLLDPDVLPDTFEQQQRQRSYFGVNPARLDVDRYTINGQVQGYIVAAREVDQSHLVGSQRNWINEHLAYTHGNGFIAAPANTVDAGGQPVYAVGNVPPSGLNGAPSPIPIDQPRIYYGALSPNYSVVRTQQGEIDGPEINGQPQTATYQGQGGVQLSSPLRKLAYTLKFGEKNLLLSSSIRSDSRIMYIREPRARVRKVAPFLELDSDSYPAVVDRRIVWIVDGYTTSAGYPYAEQTVFGDITQDSRTGRLQPARQVNYLRNSVKATVDAYTGQVTLYKFGAPDPVLESWGKAFTGILRPQSAMSPELRSHLRYPQDLFKVQRGLLAKYHESDPRAFYSQESFWKVPADPAGAVNNAANASDTSTAPQQLDLTGQSQPGAAQPPYYALLQFPGQPSARFSLSTSFTALSRPNLAAFASVSSDQADYGTIRILQLHRNDVPGPGQVANQFLTNPQVAGALLALRRNGTTLTFGNLLTLPVGGGLLYVQPVFVRANGAESFPTLQRVIVSFGSRTASESTLPAALDALLGEPAALQPPGPGSATRTPTSGGAAAQPGIPADLAAAVAAADTAYRDGLAALAKADFAEYGRTRQRLQQALQQAKALSDAHSTP